MADDNLLGNMKTYPFHQSLSAPSPEPIVG